MNTASERCSLARTSASTSVRAASPLAGRSGAKDWAGRGPLVILLSSSASAGGVRGPVKYAYAAKAIREKALAVPLFGVEDGYSHRWVDLRAVEATSRAERAAQRFAIHLFMLHDKALCARMLAAIAEHYEALREEYAGTDAEHIFEGGLPRLETESELLGQLELAGLQLLDEYKDKCAYLAFSFSCRWEREHGLGVVVHGARIVDIGGADLAIPGPWTARFDKGESTIEQDAAAGH